MKNLSIERSSELIQTIQTTENFGLYVQANRQLNDWSIRTLASKLDISRTYQNDIETGSRPAPGKDKLMVIANIFGISDSKLEMRRFFDLAANTRNGIPLDIEDFIIENPEIKELMRSIIDQEKITVSYVEEIIHKICARQREKENGLIP